MHEIEDKKSSKTYHTVLSIAGSDSIGGAGVQADIKTCTAYGVYAMTAITAITAQNTLGVECYNPVDETLLKAQLDAIIADVTPNAVKIGMLPTVQSVNVVADFISEHNIENVVLDPVCVSTSGHSLSTKEVPLAMANRLFPLVTLLTPNVPEAELFWGETINEADAETCGLELIEKFNLNALLLKGGHFSGDTCTDRLFCKNDKTVTDFVHKRICSPNTHGTGCTLSSAIASNLALGLNLADAIENATNWICLAIRSGSSYKFGHGNGPINHLFNIK